MQELSANGTLVKISVPLGANENVERVLYAYPRFVDWISNELPMIESSIVGLEETPEEQLDALFHDFISGESLAYGNRFKQLQPAQSAIWELKTADLRVFGWFPRKYIFIATAGDEKKRLADIGGLYNGYRDEAKRLRDQLDLDEPKFVPGGNVNDVI